MALATLFSKVATHGSTITSDTIELTMDATISEAPTFSNEVTNNPIEDGSSVTDHIIANPDTITIDGVITDTPVRFLSSFQDDPLTEGLGSVSRSKAAFDAIQELMANKELVTLTTRLKTYTNMAITNFQPKRDASVGDALIFSMVLKAVTIVESRTVSIPRNGVKDDPAGTRDQGQSTTAAGKQGVADASDAVTGKSSILFSALKGVSVL